MAEIHVEPKKHNTNSTWIWIVVALIIAAIVIYFLANNNGTNKNNATNPNNTTSFIQQPHPLFNGLYHFEVA